MPEFPKDLKPCALVLASCITMISAPELNAKAYHPPAREMIRKAEFIALVSLQEPVQIEKKGDAPDIEMPVEECIKQISTEMKP